MTAHEHTTVNLYTFYNEVARLGEIGRGSIAGVPWIGSPAGEWPGYLLGGAASEPFKVKQIAAAMAGDRVPAFWIRESDPGRETALDLEKVMSSHGIRMINYWTGMFLEAAELGVVAPDEPDVQLPADREWEIRKITLESEMDQWVELVNKVVMTSSQLDRGLFRKLLHAGHFYFYGLWKDDELLSTTLIFVHDQTAGLYFVATDEQHQGKGYGSAIADYAMKEVRASGAERFVLHSTRQGLKLYQKAGFREVNRYDIYWLLGKR